MTRLLTDLTTIASLHGHQHADAPVLVPIGMVRAAAIMLARYEDFPLVDRVNEVPVVPQVGRAWQRKGYRNHA